VKQVTHRLRDGRLEVLEVPPPALRPEGVLVDVRASLVSAGTERRKLEAGRKGLLGKARARPDQARKVLEKARRDGIGAAAATVRHRLDTPAPLGYSAAGVLLAVGSRVADLAPGDRVACAGEGYATHAELDYVPANLAVPIPDGVSFEDAAFTTVGAIALHAVRQADARLGERVAVVGLGLVGQLAGRILRAAGCRVIGIDLDETLVERAVTGGAVDEAFRRKDVPVSARGCDAALVTAAAPSSDPVELAAGLVRDRGRVVVVGDVGLELSRDAAYDKELEVRMSRAYGPGRYDAEYEERGLDYPIGYVRWTERRNLAAFLDLVASGRVSLGGLVTERVPVDDAPEALDRLLGASRSPLGIVIEYEPTAAPLAQAPARVETHAPLASVGLIGAGAFAASILVPALREAGFTLDAVASASGAAARGAQERLGFGRALSVDELIADPGIGLIAITTRHDSHAELAARALRAGKAVFVEKPPALTEDKLADLAAARAESGGVLAVGFNRRHAPLARELRELGGNGTAEILIRVNAGRLEEGHWRNDPEVGGGLLLGEGCHFIDLACWLAGGLPRRVSCLMRADPGRPLAAAEHFTCALDFADGTTATIVYGSEGSPKLGKESVELHAGGRSAVLDDFRRLTVHGGKSRRGGRDKGHAAQLRALLAGETEEPDPLATMAVTLAALRSAETGEAVAPSFP
jgi:predicted dehydrogenase/threonine dehydrogenase-like Zn-dependent dehydrogenase